jgi:hypothetical protein
MTGAPAGALASHPTFDVVCDVSCVLTNAEEGVRGKAHFRSWLGTEVPTITAPRPVYPQQPTFKPHVRFRACLLPLIPQQTTFWTRLGMSQVDPYRK